MLPLDEQRDALLDDEADVPIWPGSGRIAQRKLVKVPAQPAPAKAEPGPLSPKLKQAALAVAMALEAAEQTLGDLDAKSGDGDLGASMVRGAEAIRALGEDSYSSPSRLLSDLGNALRRAIAGSSGPFYATALLRASAVLANKPEPTSQDWQAALEAGTAAIRELGGAKPGDRTMVDALAPAAEAWKTSGSFADAVKAADAGARATSDMFPVLGRASYLGKRAVGFPDGGATAIAIWLAAIGESIG